MGRFKKILIGLLVAALLAGAAGAGLMQIRKNSQKEVPVTKVTGLISEYYMPSTNLEGSVTTSVSQNVTVDSDMIIEQVFVNKEDKVKVGDPLVSFDTTLVEMELEIEKLKHKKLEQDLNRAVNRLHSLKNGGPIIDSTYQGADNLDSMYRDNPDADGDMDVMSSVKNGDKGVLLASADSEAPVSSFVDDGPEYNEPEAGDFTSDDSLFTGGEDNSFSDGEKAPAPSPDQEEGGIYDPYFTPGEPYVTDGKENFYETLDSNSRPFTGNGTEKDPLIFLVSSARGGVTVMGSFFNKMAGYSEDGTAVEKEGGYWYQLEFHQSNQIADYQDRRQSCIGYYLVDGSLLARPVYMYIESEFTVDGASQYEPEYPEEPDYPGGDGGNDRSPISRQEAIRLQENRVASLKLDIQESDIKIAKLEKKVSRRLVSSKLDGIVSYVGDSMSGDTDGNAFIRVKSGDGFYVVGTVGELMLDDLKEGEILNCMSYEKGNFQAKVREVSDYPIEGGSYWGSNPNVSYYSFTAEVLDKKMEFPDFDYINITLESSAASKGSIVLQKAFTRTQNGETYVYKDDNGILKKQILSVGPTVDGGYSVLVRGGLTKEDRVAFPYGKDVKEGAKTREVEMDEMLGY